MHFQLWSSFEPTKYILYTSKLLTTHLSELHTTQRRSSPSITTFMESKCSYRPFHRKSLCAWSLFHRLSIKARCKWASSPEYSGLKHIRVFVLHNQSSVNCADKLTTVSIFCTQPNNIFCNSWGQCFRTVIILSSLSTTQDFLPRRNV